MLYQPPALSTRDEEALVGLEDLRHELSDYLRLRRRWYGTLRRATFARAVRGSNSIEGYHASVEDVAAVIDDEEPLAADDETRLAIKGYRDAMTFVLQLASAPLRVDESLLRSLQFMMLQHDLSKNPGQWRPGAIWVEDPRGDVVYAAPERELLEPLIEEFVASVNSAEGPTVVRAAMAHLNLTLIHPFSDGNGRMARCIQSLILATDGTLSPEFLSIEDYLGRNTIDYYNVLAEVGGGRWNPERHTRPWIEFVITAHHREAQGLLQRVRESELLWDQCEQLAERHRLPSRCVGALFDAARGWRLWRSLYIAGVKASTGEVITDTSATRDLKAMVAAGVLTAIGERRARHYVRAPELQAIWETVRSQRRPMAEADPYAAPSEPRLPGIDD